MNLGARERRSHQRQPVNLPGSIRAPRKPPLPCVVHDISKGGAMVTLSFAAALPTAFILDVPGNLRIRRYCTLAWQDGARAGIQFEAPPAAILAQQVSVKEPNYV